MGTVFFFLFFFFKLLLPAHGSGEQRAVQEGSETLFTPQLAFTRKTLAEAVVDGWQILRYSLSEGTSGVMQEHESNCTNVLQPLYQPEESVS